MGRFYDVQPSLATNAALSLEANTKYIQAKALFNKLDNSVKHNSLHKNFKSEVKNYKPKRLAKLKYAPYDRTSYSDRVASYGMKWSWVNGDILGPMELARWGWICTSRDTLTCTTCNATVKCLITPKFAHQIFNKSPLTLDSSRESSSQITNKSPQISYEQRRKFIQKQLEEANNKHENMCLWGRLSCPESFSTLPLHSRGLAFIKFSHTIKTWKRSSNLVKNSLWVLEGSADNLISGLGEKERRELLLVTSQQLQWPEHDVATMVATSLSLIGWESCGDHMICSVCRRLYPISLPNMAKKASESEKKANVCINDMEPTRTDEIEGSYKRKGGDLEGMPATKKVLVQGLSLSQALLSHHPFCPFLLPPRPTTCSPTSAITSSHPPTSTNPSNAIGHIMFRKMIIDHLMAWSGANKMGLWMEDESEREDGSEIQKSIEVEIDLVDDVLDSVASLFA